MGATPVASTIDDTAALGYTRILVPLDGSAVGARAAGIAAVLAQRLSAQLEYVQFVAHADIDPAEDKLRGASEAGELPPADVRVVQAAYAGDGIIEAATAGDTLVCMSTHGRGRVAGAAFGSVAGDVIRRIGTPVLLVGPALEAHTTFDFRRVVACLDGSPLSEAILPVAASWVKTLDGRLDLVSVLPPEASRVLSTGAGVAGDVSEFGYVRNLARHLADAGIAAEWEVLHGDEPADPIVRYATQEPGTVIALTTHGRSGLAHLLMGSVATRLAQGSPCPLLVMRPGQLDQD